MDSRVNFNESASLEKCRCVLPTDNAERTGHLGYFSDNYAYDTNDHATLLSNYLMNGGCLCSHSSSEFKSNHPTSKLWIAFLHILCSGILAFFGMVLTSNVLEFEKKPIEMDDVTWRSLPISLTTILPNSKDKCEPLYVLIYAHCLLWFLFLVLDHIARYLHHKTLRSRGHLRVFQRLGRLAAIPFQLVSFWTVLLAIFIAVYAQQDDANMEPYCDANSLISPKNGIATLLVLEFICVTISSLIYANAIRKFSLEKPQSDVYGWEENDYFNRWTSQALQQNDNPSVSQCPNSENFPNRHYETKCLLDLLEYYTHANKKLASKLGHASLKLRQLEDEKSPQSSEL